MLMSFMFLHCNSPEEPSTLVLNSLNRTPVITGIYVTAVDPSSVTGYTQRGQLGNPSYLQNQTSVIACPNPYNIFDVSIGQLPVPRIALYNLPPVSELQIYKGIYGFDLTGQKLLNVGNVQTIEGAVFINAPSEPIRTIEHTSGSGDEVWNLFDDNGSLVPSGFYRIFIIPVTKNANSIQWVDIYLITDKKWKDPTGWLSSSQ
jgi:hypothetical protein